MTKLTRDRERTVKRQRREEEEGGGGGDGEEEKEGAIYDIRASLLPAWCGIWVRSLVRPSFSESLDFLNNLLLHEYASLAAGPC